MKYNLPYNDHLTIHQAFKNGNNNMFVYRENEKYKIFKLYYEQYSDGNFSPLIINAVKVSDCILKRKIQHSFFLKNTDIIEVDEDMESFKQLILSGAP